MNEPGELRRYDGRRCEGVQPRLRVSGLPWVLVLAFPLVGTAAEPPLVPLDVVFMRADRAVQKDDELLEAEGHLLMRDADWTIHAEHAVVNGHLRDPVSIEVAGEPARVDYQPRGESEPLQAFSQRLEFEPREEVLRLHGDARVVKGGRSVSSESIRYLLRSDTFSAGSVGRVRVVTTPH